MLCAVCKQPIESARRKNVEKTRLCERHGREIKKFGGEFVVKGSVKNTAKVTSLKKNYSEIDVELVRNDEALENLIDEYHFGPNDDDC